MKRLFDIVVSVCGVLMLSPIFMVVACAIKIDSKGSVIFRQKRVGLKGEIFYIYKFRSMVADATVKGSYQTKVNDSRITSVGRFIRRTSIDELPQLFNVLKGDMSLVGPRPNVFEQEKLYSHDDWKLRNSVPPGITGLAQALVRSSGTPEQRTKLDLEYVSKQSFSFDIYIILLTIKQLLFKGSVN